MVDEKQSSSGPDEEPDEEKVEAQAESPWEAASDEPVEASVEAADDAVTDVVVDETPQKKSSGGRGPLLVLVILVALGAGLYFAWPILQPRLLAQLPQPVSEAMENLQALDKRVARLEAANARLDTAIAAVKGTMDDFTKQLGDLTQGVGDGETLTALGEKLAALEDTLGKLGQQAGEGGAAALAALSAEVEALKAGMTEQADGASTAAVAVPNEQVTDLARQLSVLAHENKALRQSMAEMQARLEVVEQSIQQTAQRQTARLKAGVGEGLVLALGQLRNSVLSGRPYRADLAAVTALIGKDQTLAAATAALAPWSKDGVVTLRALSDRFPAMTRAVLQADPAQSGDFWRRTLHRVTSLVTVRRVGEVEGTETDAVLARAERRLAAGELAAAVELINGLAEPGRDAAQGWLKGAKARLGAMAALATLQSQAIAGLADG